MDLWHQYQEVIFISHQPFAADSSFAIISAANPAGNNTPSGFNLCRNMALAAALHQSGVRYRKIIGASLDKRFQEPSWAVFCSKLEATSIAMAWQQNALYWIEQGELWLLPALMQQEKQALGSFQQRLILAS
ncbi:MAG: DUF3293 domain-containing protein [Alkalimonas sp.]|nr:DUF3293 domain-containing protein [Alkalimonas sp.]